MLMEGMDVWPVPPALKGKRCRHILEARAAGDALILVLEGIEDLSAASALVGKTLMVDADGLPDDLVASDARFLLGRTVEDVRLGALGEISEVLMNPFQDTLVVEGAHGQVMIPAVDAFLREVPKTGPIVVEVPDSLVGLSTEGEA